MKKLIFTTFFFIILFSFTGTSQITITLKPNADNGKDARVQSNIPDTNIGISQLFTGGSGTINGVPFIDRSLIEFDLSSVPENVMIDSAFLSLYANTVNGGHSTVEGPNDCWLEKIIEPWANNPLRGITNRLLTLLIESAS